MSRNKGRDTDFERGISELSTLIRAPVENFSMSFEGCRVAIARRDRDDGVRPEDADAGGSVYRNSTC